MQPILPPCSAIGIGSLPHADSDAAVAAVRSVPGFVPFWPQLPRRSARESILNHVIGPYLDEDPAIDSMGRPVLSDPAMEKISSLPSPDAEIEWDESWVLRVSEWSAALIPALETFTPEANGPVFKGQLAGPVTLGSYWRDMSGRALIDDEVLMTGIEHAVLRSALLQIREITDRDWRPLIFLDEPGIFRATDTAREMREKGLSRLRRCVDTLRRHGAAVGLHACGGLEDPSVFSLGVDFLSFDAAAMIEDTAYAKAAAPPGFFRFEEEIDAFLHNGGQLVWGVVPSSRGFDKGEFKPSQRWFPLVKSAFARRRDWQEILESSHVSTSCGLAGLTESESEEALRLTALTCVIARMSLATREKRAQP